MRLHKELRPQSLKAELAEYRAVLGKEFGLTELLQIYDIRAKMRIAANIIDMPEQLCHEQTIAEKDGYGIASAILHASENKEY